MATIQSIRKITLDVSRQNERIINVKQGDQNSRKLNIEVFDDRNPVSIPTGVTVVFSAKLFDGTYANSSGTVEADGTVTVEFTPAMVAVGGQAEADVQFIGTTDNRLSSLNFYYYVHKQAVPDDAVTESDQFSALVTALSEVADFATVKAEVQTARGGEASLDARLDSIESDVSGNAADITEIESRTTAAEQAIVALDAGLTGGLERITENEDDIATLAGRVESAEADIVNLEAKAATAETNIAALQSKDASHDIAIAAAQQAIQQNQNTIANMGDGRVTVDAGYGNISALPKSAAIAAMNSILYGATATNLVVNGDFSNGATGWSGTGGSTSVANNILSLTGTGSTASPRVQTTTNILLSTGKKAFIKAKIKVTNSDCSKLEIRATGSTSGTLVVVKTINTPVINQEYSIFEIFTQTDQVGNLVISFWATYVDSATANTKVMQLKEVIAVDLTAQGESTLTQTQLDVKYANYFSGTQSAQCTCIEATGKNLFDNKRKVDATSTNASSSPIPTGIRVSNGVVNSYQRVAYLYRVIVGQTYKLSYTASEISGTQTNKCVVNVVDSLQPPIAYTVNLGVSIGTGVKTLTFTAPTSGFVWVVFFASYETAVVCVNEYTSIQLEKDTATPYEPYKLTEQYIEPKTLYRVPNGAACKIDTARNEYVPNVKRYVLTEADVKAMLTGYTNVDLAQISRPTDMVTITGNIVTDKGIMLMSGIPQIDLKPNAGDYLSTDINKFNVSNTQNINVLMPKGTTLAAAKTALANTVIYYQLSPTAIEQNTLKGVVSGNLLSRPNGTIQFCNKHSFISLVADGKLPTRTWYADIGTVERLEKFNSADNTWTPLDVSLAVISADKRYATLPAQYNGSLIRCKYSYTYNGVNGRKDINYLNAVNIKLAPDGKYYLIDHTIDASGNVIHTKTEVA